MTVNRAVKLVPENFSLITTDSDVKLETLVELYEDAISLEETRYFCPSFTTIYGRDTKSWAAIREDALRDKFTYDNDKIDTEFVEITQLIQF